MCAKCAAIAYTPKPCHNIVTPRGERKESKTPTDLPTYSQKGTTMANITRKQLTNALIANADVNKLAEWLATDDIATVADALAKLEQSTNRKRVSKPSAETKRNRAICDDILAEFNARNGEFTAAEVADMTTDPDGIPMTTRKVAALLSQMVKRGELAKSPEKWASAHYGLPGYEFAPKPKRVKKSEQTENTPEDVTEDVTEE